MLSTSPNLEPKSVCTPSLIAFTAIVTPFWLIIIEEPEQNAELNANRLGPLQVPLDVKMLQPQSNALEFYRLHAEFELARRNYANQRHWMCCMQDRIGAVGATFLPLFFGHVSVSWNLVSAWLQL